MADASTEGTKVESLFPKTTVVKVLVAVPNEGGTLCDAYDNRLLFMQRLGCLEVLSKLQTSEYNGNTYYFPEGVSYEFAFGTVANVLTPIARERLAEIAIDNGFDYVLFIDDDMICPPEMFEQLFRHQKDIVAALAFTRFAPHKPVIYVTEQGFDATTRQDYYMCKSWTTYPKDQLVECDAVGFGAVLINCKTFRTMPKPWFTAASGKGEDIQFCLEAGRSGFKVYMDTSCKLGHLGPPINVTEEFYEQATDVKEKRELEERSNTRLNGEDIHYE